MGVMDCMRALVWTMLFIIVITYVFSVCLTQMVTAYKVHHRAELDMDNSEVEQLFRFFGSLGATFLSLYEVFLDGTHWDKMLDPLRTIPNPLPAIAFVVYISICTVGVMNMVTSVFITSVMRHVEEDKRAVLMQQMRLFFKDADEDGSGTISRDEFDDHVTHPMFQHYLREIDLSPDHARLLFRLLDVEHTGDLEIDDIVSGCLRLHGPAKSLDLNNFIANFERSMDLSQQRLDEHTEHITRLITAAFPMLEQEFDYDFQSSRFSVARFASVSGGAVSGGAAPASSTLRMSRERVNSG